jgi:hypothetical protein
VKSQSFPAWPKCLLVLSLFFGAAARADEPKPTPANTITIQVTEPPKPQKFPRPLKIFVADVVDRSGNAQPMLVWKPRGGVFLDRPPVEITRAGLVETLKAADMLATERESADFLMNVYLFNFGLNNSSGFDFFGKVELAVQLKNPKTNKSQQITASGTSIANAALRKKNILKNVQENIEQAFADALRNLLRGEKLRDALAALDVAAEAPAAQPAPAASEKP